MKHCLIADKAWLRWGVLLGGFLTTLISGYAVERTLVIDSPAYVVAGDEVLVHISASTNALDEEVGFLQVESSVDDGATWVAICYLQNSGPEIEQTARIISGPVGTTVRIRARAAYRGGLAGDVDYLGAAILWQRSWEKWATPPAKQASIVVKDS